MTKKGALIIAITTLLTVMAWVVFDIIHARSQVNIPEDIQSVIAPINPNFDLGPLQ